MKILAKYFFLNLKKFFKIVYILYNTIAISQNYDFLQFVIILQKIMIFRKFYCLSKVP